MYSVVPKSRISLDPGFFGKEVIELLLQVLLDAVESNISMWHSKDAYEASLSIASPKPGVSTIDQYERLPPQVLVVSMNKRDVLTNLMRFEHNILFDVRILCIVRILMFEHRSTAKCIHESRPPCTWCTDHHECEGHLTSSALYILLSSPLSWHFSWILLDCSSWCQLRLRKSKGVMNSQGEWAEERG